MMSKPVVWLVLIAMVVSVGCYGPMKLTRQVDDWANQIYVDSPWLGQIVGWIVLPIAMPVTNIIDWIILNPISFWGEDVWKNQGTPFDHKNPVVGGATK